MYIDARYNNEEIHYWYRNKQGDLISKVVPACSYYYFYVPNERGKYKTIYGKNVSPMYFTNFKKFKDRGEDIEETYEADIAVEYKFLSDNFYKDTSGSLPNIALYDIEVDYNLENGLGFPVPDNPHGEVNSISLYDITKKQYHLIYLNPQRHHIHFEDEEEGNKIIFYECVTERQVLDTFIRVLDDIDILAAWNGAGFDLPYLIHRMCRVYGSREGMSAMCRGGFPVDMRESVDKFGNEKTIFKLVGRSHVDLMDVYMKFATEKKPSYKLDSICEEELGEKKLEYDGDLGELYRTDPQKFFEYSFRDTYLLKKLEDKLKYMDTVVAMANQATIKYNEVLGTVSFLEHSILNHCHFDRKDPLILPDRDTKSEKEPFEGGFVIPTRPDVYGWTMSQDLTSLYPSVVRALNLSPETFIMQLTGKFDDFIKVTKRSKETVLVKINATGEHFEIAAHEMNDLIKEEGLTISANGSIFTNEFRGILPEVLTIWFNKRASIKKKMKETEDEELKSFYFREQNMLKLSMNSVFGVVGNANSRFHDVNLASSITLTGQEINKFQGVAADKLIDGLTILDKI